MCRGHPNDRTAPAFDCYLLRENTAYSLCNAPWIIVVIIVVLCSFRGDGVALLVGVVGAAPLHSGNLELGARTVVDGRRGGQGRGVEGSLEFTCKINSAL